MRIWLRIRIMKIKKQKRKWFGYSVRPIHPCTLHPFIIWKVCGRFRCMGIVFVSKKKRRAVSLSVRRARRHDKSLNFTVRTLCDIHSLHYLVDSFWFHMLKPVLFATTAGRQWRGYEEEIANDKLTEIHIIFRSHFSHHRDTKKTCQAVNNLFSSTFFFPIWKWLGENASNPHSQFTIHMHANAFRRNVRCNGSKRAHTQNEDEQMKYREWRAMMDVVVVVAFGACEQD